MPSAKGDDGLAGMNSKRAVEFGLLSAEWYHAEVPCRLMKERMPRTHGPAIRDTVIRLHPSAPHRRGLPAAFAPPQASAPPSLATSVTRS